MSSSSVDPIYIVGNSRSGTTILSIGLGKHTEIFNFREIHFFEKYWAPDKEKQRISYAEALTIAEKLIGCQKEGFLYCKHPAEYKDQAQQLLNNIKSPECLTTEGVYSEFLYSEAHRGGKTIPCEQTPHNISYLVNIFDIFPNARVIAMVRDPRDILLSQKNKSKMRYGGTNKIPLKERIRTWANYHPYVMSLMWKRVSEEIEEWRDDPRVMVVKFEDLIESPEQVLMEISKFIGVDFQKAMLEVPQTGSSNISDNTKKIGINKEVTGKWKTGLSPTEIRICQRVNAQKIHSYGYEWSNINSNYLSIFPVMALLPVKATLALILNIGRSKSIWRSIMKRIVGS